MAHHMAAAGGGFLWPRVQFLSDGAFIEVIARPSPPSAAEPLRFVGEVVGLRERLAWFKPEQAS